MLLAVGNVAPAGRTPCWADVRCCQRSGLIVECDTMIVDVDAVVFTIGLRMRSVGMHFECGCYWYQHRVLFRLSGIVDGISMIGIVNRSGDEAAVDVADVSVAVSAVMPFGIVFVW